MKAPGEKFIVAMTLAIFAFALALRAQLTAEFATLAGVIVGAFNLANAYITKSTAGTQQ